MSDDKAADEKSTEEQNVKIDAIVGDEALGYKGAAHGEHSGESAPRRKDGLAEDLADNRPDQVK